MSTTIFTAPEYDPKKLRRRNQKIAGIIVVILILFGVAWVFRNYPEERVVNHFFEALEHRDYEKAYGIWMADPNWKQHPERHSRYPFHDFYLDWGPGGEYGLIHSHKIEGSANPRHGSGVIVVVSINERKEPARLWVQKSDKSLTFSPY